jgi:formylglycine-generating enzyme required for sulfatase activity
MLARGLDAGSRGRDAVMLTLRRIFSLSRAPLIWMACVVLASCGGDEGGPLSSDNSYRTSASVGGVELVLVAPGGSLVVNGAAFDVEPFYIAKHEATHGQYDEFLRADDGFDNPAWWSDLPAESSPPERPFDRPRTGPLLRAPRGDVLWYQALAYTRWLNVRRQARNADISEGGLLVNGVRWEVRLPTEWEWQWAAQGGAEAREYPWGDWADRNANTVEEGLAKARTVGSYPTGAAASGALDMSGNVWEWCLNNWKSPHATAVDRSNAARALRGGSYRDPGEHATSSSRSGHFPRRGRSDVGFRVGVFPPR